MFNKFLEFFKKKDSSKVVYPKPYEKRKIGYIVEFKDKSRHAKEYLTSSEEETDKILKEVDEALKEIQQALKETSGSDDFINCLGVVFKKDSFIKAYMFNFPEKEKNFVL
jgi:hypothetical protein